VKTLYDKLKPKHRQTLNELRESLYYQHRVDRVKSILQSHSMVIDMTIQETHDCFCILEPSKDYDLDLFYNLFYELV